MDVKKDLLHCFFVVTISIVILFSGWCDAGKAIASSAIRDNGARMDDNASQSSDTGTPENEDVDEFDEFNEFDEFDDEFDGFDEFDRHDTIVYDPLSGYNRAMTTFNDRFYFLAFKPAATGYAKITPVPVRSSINNFFRNVGYPVRLANNLFQLKGEAALRETTRFMVNTTVGIAGFFDPGETWLGIAPNNEDFGQTLGWYGVGSGFHFVLPFFGPSNLRDSTGMVMDWFFDPVFYMEGYYIGSVSMAVDEFNYTSLHLGDYERLKKEAIDLYIFLRNAYEQNREKKIRE